MAKEVGPGDFFDLIFGPSPAPGYVTLATYPGNGVFDPNPNVGPTQELWFEWPKERTNLVATVRQHKSADIYFCPAVFKNKPEKYVDEHGVKRQRYGRRKDNIQWLGVAYADADLAAPESFKVKPSIIVETSPHRTHLYWLLANPSTPEEIARSGQVIAHTHADEGCDTGGWDLTQLLRVPGTTNNKPTLDKPHRARALVEGMIYATEDIHKAYPVDGPLPTIKPPEDIPEDLPEYDEALSQVAHLNQVADLLRVKGRAPSKDGKQEGNRSQLMWMLLRTLAENDIPKKTAFVLGWQVGYCKARLKGQGKGVFWREVCKAYEYMGIVEEELPSPPPALVKPSTPIPVRLLTEPERENLAITIMDHYVGWAGTKTDAAKQYHEAAILTILGNVFGEYGKPSVKHESGFLNMWFLVLGGTTLSRKSTVKKMMTKFLRHISDDQFFYDLGSNVTPEGLHNELLDRGGLSSLYHRDEVHGLLAEQKHKHYLAGLQEMMTELYDGTVQGKLRATGNTKSGSVDTVFHMYMTGVTEHVTEAYSLKAFESGHLARFLFVHADPPPLTEESVRIEQAEESEQDKNGLFLEEEDRAYELLLKQVRDARTWWGERVRRGEQVRIFWEKDAWERLNKALYKAVLWAEHHPKYRKILKPTIQRSMHQILKVATLLAMSERETRVQMRHLLRALKFGEQCFQHLLVVLDRINQTDRTKMLDDIVMTVVAQGEKGINAHQLYNKFKDACTMGEFSPMVQDLVSAGQIKVSNDKVYALEPS